MATLQEEKNMLDALEKNLEVLSGITPESLVRKEELGVSLSFEEGLPSFRRTLKLFNDLKNANKDGVPYNTLNELNNLAVNCIEEFKKVKEFSMDKYPQNPVNSRDSLITTVRDRYDEYYKKLTPHIAYSIRKGTDFEALESQARDTLTELIKTKNDIIEEQKKAKKDSDSILESMRKAAGDAGVSQNAVFFSIEAEEHKENASNWLNATKWMAIATVIFAILATASFFIFARDLKFEHALQLGIAKILIFSIFYYATIWCGKNYRAYVHNYVVNKHRQNGLNTFQTFVKATEDEAIKNAVLLKCTESIFGLSNSGFISSESDQSGSSQILEIIRSGFNSKSGAN